MPHSWTASRPTGMDTHRPSSVSACQRRSNADLVPSNVFHAFSLSCQQFTPFAQPFKTRGFQTAPLPTLRYCPNLHRPPSEIGNQLALPFKNKSCTFPDKISRSVSKYEMWV